MKTPTSVERAREVQQAIDEIRVAHDALNAVTINRRRFGAIATKTQSAGHALAYAERRLRTLLAALTNEAAPAGEVDRTARARELVERIYAEAGTEGALDRATKGVLGFDQKLILRLIKDADEERQRSDEAALAPQTTPDVGVLVEAARVDDTWKQYEADFNALTDKEIEDECNACRDQVDEAESWLEAVASWEAAGKPRRAALNPVTNEGESHVQ